MCHFSWTLLLTNTDYLSHIGIGHVTHFHDSDDTIVNTFNVESIAKIEKMCSLHVDYPYVTQKLKDHVEKVKKNM